jgi:hypothetical protein
MRSYGLVSAFGPSQIAHELLEACLKVSRIGPGRLVAGAVSKVRSAARRVPEIRTQLLVSIEPTWPCAPLILFLEPSSDFQ